MFEKCPTDQATSTSRICSHCDSTIIVPFYINGESEGREVFCCAGCRAVFEILHQKGLERYYDIKSKSEAVHDATPASELNSRFIHFDDDDFQKEYIIKNDKGHKVVRFYLEGVHCLACLWLIEKIPQFVPGIIFSRLDLGKAIATITFKEDFPLSKIGFELQQFGYRPHILKIDENGETQFQKEERSMLIKIGVAAACAGNIMLFAISIYAGVSGKMANIFSWLSFFITIPVMSYSALPFYQSAYGSLKNKILSIDVPVVFAILLAFIYSTFELLNQGTHMYFDSITSLVFLLLSARFILRRMQKSGIGADQLEKFFSFDAVKKINEDGEEVEILPKYLKRGDIIRVTSNSQIPVDGVIVKGNSNLNLSLLTGESLPVEIKPGDLVYSGTVNLDSTLEIRVDSIGSETRLGQILHRIECESQNKSQIVRITDKIGKYFVYIVLTLGLLVFTYFALRGELSTGIERALGLIIISCPCALALATPLALSYGLKKAADLGIFVKSDDIIERIYRAKEIFLDKTGTLTYGLFQVVKVDDQTPQDLNLYEITYALEAKSSHPIAKALKDFCLSKLNGTLNKEIFVHNYKEYPGVGVTGECNGGKYKLIKASDNFESLENVVELKCQVSENILARFFLKDNLRVDSLKAMDTMRDLGLTPYMISGDRREIVSSIADSLRIPPGNYISDLKPEDKAKIIGEHPFSIMVGDGANDAIALVKSLVGIAVHGSVEVSLRAADVYNSRPGVLPISNLINIAHETIKVVKRNLILSLLYNVIGVLGALLGHITPLWAAIFMPLSSLTVILSTIYGTKKMRQNSKGGR
ncbi:MAG: heavy metal translocating P-type ATPase [Halobacteriovoraceae bacterium]|nr:heavy metal translocating P-type ATPase [Halobacteriovoraceae bacterium]